MLGGPAQDWSITLPLSNTRVRSQRAGGSGEPTGTPMPTPIPTPPPPPILKPPRPTPTLDCAGGEESVTQVCQSRPAADVVLRAGAPHTRRTASQLSPCHEPFALSTSLPVAQAPNSTARRPHAL